MKVDHNEALNLLRKWQDILCLNDWNLSLRIRDSSWRKSGDIDVTLEYATGSVLIREVLDDLDLDTVIVHELVHIKLYALDQMIEELLGFVYGDDAHDPKKKFAYSQFMGVLERTAEDLTRALLDAEGRKPIET